ncbi:hypothetical protein L1887_42624 [Cichorium endivia]|nr:hypothetical protein L1887_42624 [Cichorium endivia]
MRCVGSSWRKRRKRYELDTRVSLSVEWLVEASSTQLTVARSSRPADAPLQSRRVRACSAAAELESITALESGLRGRIAPAPAADAEARQGGCERAKLSLSSVQCQSECDRC